MDNLVLAYLAGVIDSEGCMTIQKSVPYLNQQGGCAPSYSERLSVSMKDIEPIRLLSATFHQDYYVYYLHANSNPDYTLIFTSKKAIRAIKVLLPYLRTKRRQAELLLQFRKYKDGLPLPTSRNPRSPEILQRQEEFYLELQEINHEKSN